MERRQLYLAAIACSVGLILVSIFPWRGFDPSGHWHRVGWIPFVSRPVRVIDVVANLALFVPLGASIALYTQRAALVPTLAAAFVCSFAGEWAQVYSRYRYPSGGDLVCNILGAVVAVYGVDRWRRGRLGGVETSVPQQASEPKGSSVAITYGVQAPVRTNEKGGTGVD